MTDWKQITARIRRARTSKDPAGQLSNLFQKTRDAMVAFELAKYFESSGQNADAAKWYSAAAQRFRRADWKTKAQEAAIRLGGAPGEIALESGTPVGAEFALTPPAVSTPEPELHSNRTRKRSNHRWRSAAKSSRRQKVQRMRLQDLREKAVGEDAAVAGIDARAAL